MSFCWEGAELKMVCMWKNILTWDKSDGHENNKKVKQKKCWKVNVKKWGECFEKNWGEMLVTMLPKVCGHVDEKIIIRL